ncbi:UNVERIFIED_CONTAM: Ca(2+)-dependent cysteine protease [Siphonaria sp. JEL0065]|nr:Ca(2+)-dependent cysteine protease [Siphonaria sp. JEL0065]
MFSQLDNLVDKVLNPRQAQQQPQQFAVYPGQQARAMGPPQPQLPPGWVAQWSQQYNTYFYANSATGETQWTVPQFAPQQLQYQQPYQQQQVQQQPPPPQVNYVGRRKAVYVGINYTGTSNALRGCHEDVRAVKKFMDSQAQWESMVLTDIPQHQNTNCYPTRQNIINAMIWLVAGARPGDHFFFHYSGHGAQEEDQDGDEQDGMDSTICPVDFKYAGQIVDDDLHRIMCQPLPQGAYFLSIFDCCHSGTMLDLPFTYILDANDQVLQVDNRKAAGKALLNAGLSMALGDPLGAISSAMQAKNFIMKEMNNPTQQQQQIQGEGLVAQGNKMTMATCISFTGCRDDQTSADAYIAGRNTGAMSWAFIQTLTRLEGYRPSYVQVLREMRNALRNEYEQVPQLGAGFQMDLNSPFVL